MQEACEKYMKSMQKAKSPCLMLLNARISAPNLFSLLLDLDDKIPSKSFAITDE